MTFAYITCGSIDHRIRDYLLKIVLARDLRAATAVVVVASDLAQMKGRGISDGGRGF